MAYLVSFSRRDTNAMLQWVRRDERRLSQFSRRRLLACRHAAGAKSSAPCLFSSQRAAGRLGHTDNHNEYHPHTHPIFLPLLPRAALALPPGHE